MKNIIIAIFVLIFTLFSLFSLWEFVINDSDNISVRVKETFGSCNGSVYYKAQFKKEHSFLWHDFLWFSYRFKRVQVDVFTSPESAISRYYKFKTYQECIEYNNKIKDRKRQYNKKRRNNRIRVIR